MTFQLTEQLAKEIEEKSGRDPQREANEVFDRVRSAYVKDKDGKEEPLNLTIEQHFLLSVYFLSGLVQDELLEAFRPHVRKLAQLFHIMYYYNIWCSINEKKE